MEKENFRNKHYSKFHSTHWRNFQMFLLPPLETAFFDFIWHKTEYWYNNKKESRFYWTYRDVKEELRIERTQLERLSKYFTEKGIIIKTTEKLRIGSQVTRVQYYSLNFHSLTNPELLGTFVKPEFIHELQSEFSYLANMIGYFDKPVVKYVEPLQEVKDFYNNQIFDLYKDEKNIRGYFDFCEYIITDKNPFGRPLNEISSLPGQPTYPEFETMRKQANRKYVDFYRLLAKYVDNPPKTKSFTVSFMKWIETEKVDKTTKTERWSLRSKDAFEDIIENAKKTPF